MSIMCPPANAGYTFIPGAVGEEPGLDMDFKYFTAPSPSVDQELLKNVPSLQGTPIASLQLGAALESMKGAGDEALRVLSCADFNQALWPESRPNVAFDNIFGGVVIGGDPTAMIQARARNKSVLDFMTADLNRLKSRVPMSQLPKLESHLAAIRSLETQGAGVSASCQKPVLGALPAVVPMEGLTVDDVQHGVVAQQQLETIRSAFLCDLTRVATFTFGQGNSDLKVFGGLTVSEGHHTLSHNGDESADKHAEIDKFSNDITAKLLLDMKNTPDGAASLLDNTLVVYFTECTLGAGHTINDNPIALFGGKFLGLNGGSYLQFSGRTHADLWVETFKRFGYNKPMHGAARWNLGPLPGLYG